MGSILVVMDSTNYYRNIETVDCKIVLPKKPSVAEEVCQHLLLKYLSYPKLNRLLKIHKDRGP
jgi:hypothetical protein